MKKILFLRYGTVIRITAATFVLLLWLPVVYVAAGLTPFWVGTVVGLIAGALAGYTARLTYDKFPD